MSDQIKITVSSTDGRYFSLSPSESIQLELKLNVTKYGRPWKHIGDFLFEFGRAINSQEYLVSVTQFEFLDMLNGKASWNECKGLE
jgi:hypothetical protein